MRGRKQVAIFNDGFKLSAIKKESPNEGTETQIDYCCYKAYFIIHIRILTSFLYLLYIFSYVLSSVFIFFYKQKARANP